MFTNQADSRILVAFELDCKPTYPVEIIYAYKIAQKFCNSTLKVTVVSEFWSNQNKHDKNKCDNNLMRVIHKAGDCHLHHKWQWLAAITPHWLLQLWTVSVQKCMIVRSKFQTSNCTNICILSFCHIFRSNRSTKSWRWLAIKNLSPKVCLHWRHR